MNPKCIKLVFVLLLSIKVSEGKKGNEHPINDESRNMTILRQEREFSEVGNELITELKSYTNM